MAHFLALNCCGIQEFANVGHHLTPRVALKTALNGVVVNRKNTYRGTGSPNEIDGKVDNAKTGQRHILATASLLFTCHLSAKPNYGTKMSDYIKEHKLGDVVELPPFKNTNTGNPITTYLWVINNTALNEWWDREKDLP